MQHSMISLTLGRLLRYLASQGCDKILLEQLMAKSWKLLLVRAYVICLLQKQEQQQEKQSAFPPFVLWSLFPYRGCALGVMHHAFTLLCQNSPAAFMLLSAVA